MAQFESYEDFGKSNPLARYSFYASGRVKALLELEMEIVAKLDATFPSAGTVKPEPLDRAEILSWLWILGAYEVIRTMCQAKKCFSQHANDSLLGLRRELGSVRMPAAKMEKQGKPEAVASSRSPAGVCPAQRDLLVGDPYHPTSLRPLLGHFRAVVSQIKDSDVLDSHESVYGGVNANNSLKQGVSDKPKPAA